MAAHVKGKQIDWSAERDSEGHRTYHITWLLMCDSTDDGPQAVIECEDLPAEGSAWAFGNDFDEWAWCRPDMTVRRHEPKGGERHLWYTAEQTFSTKPPDPSKQRCQDTPIEDPLLEPAKVSGGGVKYTEEATQDRFGQPITNSALEQIRGPKAEFDANRNTIKIQQNVGSYNDILIAEQMRDTLNVAPIWGKPYRCVKLSGVDFVRQFWQQCTIYYSRTLTFDVDVKLDPETGNYVSGFDRDLLDEGTMVLNGQWDSTSPTWVTKPIPGYSGTPNPDPSNPTHFIRFKGRDNQARNVILNGAGLPAGVAIVGTELYISLRNANIGNSLFDSMYWLAYVGLAPGNVIGVPLFWLPGISYAIGQLVFWGGTIYIALQPNINDQPDALVPGEPIWQNLFRSIMPSTVNYSASTSYSAGAVVLNTSTPLQPGNIHVEKYGESDFTLLGIPLNFDTP